jgi:Ca-activated chloride channel family protein
VDGGTNVSAALQRARRALSGSDAKVRRAILISDGVPTEGETDPAGLMRLAGRLHQDGISVSAIGVGLDFNENLMAGIAEHGSGAYGYLKDASALATLFQKDLQQASTLVARGIQLSFELPAGVTLAQVYGRAFTQQGRTVTVQLPDLSSGQLERVVLRATVVGARPGETVQVANLSLRYRDLLAEQEAGVQVALRSTVSAHQAEVLARRDTQAVVAATRAQAAVNLREAAESIRQGDEKKAKGFLQKNLNLYGQANALAGEPVMKDEAEYDRALLPSAAAAPAEREDVVKKAKAHARANFGSAGSTYSAP